MCGERVHECVCRQGYMSVCVCTVSVLWMREREGLFMYFEVFFILPFQYTLNLYMVSFCVQWCVFSCTTCI